MSDEEALLQAIYANHDEDTPRLIYADWLDEHGQSERAEFIRLQVELAYVNDEDPRERPLRDRRWELWEAHGEQWTAEIGIVESENVKVEFRRGFIDELNIYAYIPGAIELVCRVPGVRRVSLGRVVLTPDAVRKLAALDLDALTIRETAFPVEWLELLESLPCGTVLDVTPKDEPFAPEVWREFQSRRIGRLTQLAPAERLAEARRWQRGHDQHHGDTRGLKTVCLYDVKACDAEMQLLAELREIEEVRIDECDLTATGLAHIAKLPKLKSLNLFWVPTASLAPLSCCISLEKLRALPKYETTIDDAGTEGLEQLVNLRELTLRARGAGELTLARLGTLRKLATLDIELRQIENADSFAALSHLTALEQLEIEGEVPGNALRYLAPCRKLRAINLSVPTGTADDFAALGLLTELREVHIMGDAVTDAALWHFTPLKKLRKLMVQRTEVTPVGAWWLADQLPEVTIIMGEYVAKSQRPAIAFCRRLANEEGGRASAMIPTCWSGHWGRSNVEPCRPMVEDGWDNVRRGNYEVVGPAEIRLYVRDEISPEVVLADLVKHAGPDYQPSIEERDIVELGEQSTSCIYTAGRDRCFVVVVASEGKCAVLECDAPKTRFEEFRPLFMFVARSLRVGDAALQGVGEEVTVAVSQLGTWTQSG